jgi:hypothetical protein
MSENNEPGKYRRKENKSKGLGDSVSKIINKVAGGKIKECDSCKKRKEMLNKLFPYKNKEKKND